MRIEAKVVPHNRVKVHMVLLECANMARILMSHRNALQGVETASSQAATLSNVSQFTVFAGVTVFLCETL